MEYIYIVVVENIENNANVEYAFTKESYAVEWFEGHQKQIEEYNLTNIKCFYKKVAILE